MTELSVGREVGNALGRLEAEEPRFSPVFDRGSYAKFAKSILAGLDLYCRDRGIINHQGVYDPVALRVLDEHLGSGLAWRQRDMDARRVLVLP